MSGYIGDLSERQQAALEQFRDAVADVKRPTDTDAFLLRWLRARDFDVAKAETMYRNDIQWRKENGVDDMMHSYKTPQIVKENFPGIIIHPCKDGRPMWIIPAGVNMKDFVAVLTPSVVQRHITYQLEYIESLKRSSSRGKEIETQYLVIDFDRFSLLQLYSLQAVKTITDMLTTIENHFPECLEKCIAINAPYFFPVFWHLVRPFLSQRTAEKVQVFKKEGWKEYLLSIVDAAHLPAVWGGDMVGPGNDPQCRHKVNYGGRFEEGLDLSGCSVFGEAGAQRRTIGRRHRWERPVSVTKAGRKLALRRTGHICARVRQHAQLAEWENTGLRGECASTRGVVIVIKTKECICDQSEMVSRTAPWKNIVRQHE
ncbi:hypothetical protein V5799_031950 [Amblyomma americanum]|uniref:CRAL-TRIO domain-containing protein n=1 Tax=Amblyomma americanum TaxID=6943 RepID=A0AAQ4DSK2_AMBAM